LDEEKETFELIFKENLSSAVYMTLQKNEMGNVELLVKNKKFSSLSAVSAYYQKMKGKISGTF
jgi:hypothetical protein